MAGIFSLRRLYLIIYNWTLFLGWVQVLYLAVKSTIKNSGPHSVYDAVHKPLILAQSAAVLEILHSLLGIIRSPPVVTVLQIGSRLYVTWGILYSFPQIQSHFFIVPLIISWSITEIIRYWFFAVKEAFRFTPWWLVWMRYSTFLVLYPAGIASEVGLIYNALPYLRKSENSSLIRLTSTYNWNLSFVLYYNALVILGFYVPGFPHLYGYMLGQRKKALARAKK